MNRSLLPRVFAVFMSVALIASTSPLTAAPAPGSLTGSVVAADGKAPLTGAVVHVADTVSHAVISSAPTGSDGSFAIAEIPAGTYEVGIQAGRELYLVRTPVTLAPGQSRSVALAVRPADDEEPGRVGSGSPRGWNNPLVASLIVVGSAIALGLVIDQVTDDDDSTSPSQP